MSNENIVAISTALGVGGVAVLRVSGDSPLSIAEQMFVPLGKTKVKDFEPYKMYVGEIVCKNFTDFGMCVYFKSPKSFTGEDMVEFHCHGGIAITKGILKEILSRGARLATNGEFTKRAFINGKLSLSSAEGLIDMINSEADSGVKAGYYLYREKLTKRIVEMQDEVSSALAEIDVDMDFPEEDLEVNSRKTATDVLTRIIPSLDEILSTFRQGRIVKNGVRVGIVGKPNTGKSSLLNGLLQYDKAIVSDYAGTTRDVVEGSIDIDGVQFNFSDTAGIRESQNAVEELGIMLSKKILDESDLLLFVIDGGKIDEHDNEIYELIKDKNIITVMNKCDKPYNEDDRVDIKISALENKNLDGLRKLIFDKTVGCGIDLNGDFLCEERHYEALTRAREKFVSALNNIDNTPLDIVAIDVKDGWDALGEISGKTATDEIIDRIFSKFCVGK